MFPTNQADVEPNGRTMDRRLDPGTTTVPVPKARRLLMTSAAEAETNFTTINRESALALARDVVRLEAQALTQLIHKIDESLFEAATRIAETQGIIHVTGMGKAGWVGQKFAATAASLGFRAFFLHPAEAVHGDMGRVSQGDLVIAMSQSGETEELLRLTKAVHRAGATIIALTESPTNPLGQESDLTISLGRFQEACPMGLAPTTSTTVMMAMSDALAILSAQIKGVLPHHFAANHPAGKLGRRLTGVDQIMRTGRHVRIAHQSELVRDVLTRLGGARRRSGAILVTSEQGGPLVGIFTDSDLVRLLERGRINMLDQPISESMTLNPSVIRLSATVADAVEALQARKLSELPVVNELGQPIGLIDVTDLIGLAPFDFDEEALL
jgi:arabinose-5-phosphate isomerase